jgi:hypothetical protein
MSYTFLKSDIKPADKLPVYKHLPANLTNKQQRNDRVYSLLQAD